MADKHDNKFYWSAAFKMIEDELCYYKTVHKVGIYEGKRAYVPILNDEFKDEPPVIGFPLVILVDDDGHAEYIRDFVSLDILAEIRKKKQDCRCLKNEHT